MVFIQILGIIACLLSIALKTFFAYRQNTLNALLAVEHKAHQVSKKELNLAKQTYQTANIEQKKLTSQHRALERNIRQITLVHQKISDEQNAKPRVQHPSLQK